LDSLPALALLSWPKTQTFGCFAPCFGDCAVKELACLKESQNRSPSLGKTTNVPLASCCALNLKMFRFTNGFQLCHLAEVLFLSGRFKFSERTYPCKNALTIEIELLS
jgi:hypothetical protein